MSKTKTMQPEWPEWYDGQTINESLFCQQFLREHKLLYTENAFFTIDGRMTDDTPLKTEIFRLIKPYAVQSVSKKITNIIELLKINAYVEDFPPQEDRIHLINGTLFLDGRFFEGKDEIVRSRLQVAYVPHAAEPKLWLKFLHELLHEEDILTLQEFFGYCLIPTNKAQRMLIIKGNGGEGKTQVGAVAHRLFGTNAKDGSVGKVSENQFARADLEHIHLMIDDDMRMEALRQTNYVKSLVTAQGKMDLERKRVQSYQGWLYARRQLILTAKEKSPDRLDDPDLVKRICGEAEGIVQRSRAHNISYADNSISPKSELEGIFNWAYEGLKRLMANGFRFTESKRSIASREVLKQDANNVILFMEASDYIELDGKTTLSSKELFAVYTLWCGENGFTPLKQRSFSDYLVSNQRRYGITHGNAVRNVNGRRVWGFTGIRPLIDPTNMTPSGIYRVFPEDNPFELMEERRAADESLPREKSFA